MCRLQVITHSCGCRDESRIEVCDHLIHHRPDARCFEMLSCRRRRRRYCPRHQPTTRETVWEYPEVILRRDIAKFDYFAAMVVTDFKGQPPDGQSRSLASASAGHRQTVPTPGEDDEASELQELPPPYEAASAPANNSSNPDENDDAPQSRPENITAASPAQGEIASNEANAANISATSVQTADAHGDNATPAEIIAYTPQNARLSVDLHPVHSNASRPPSPPAPVGEAASSPYTSRRPSSVNSSSYQPPERMSYGTSWEQKDAGDYWDQYDNLSGTFCSSRAGCCCSDRDGVCWSDRQGKFCSDHDGCCFSDRNGCCFSDNDGCCFSDNDGCCFSGAAPGAGRKLVPSTGTFCR
ncbi:hypothetical protein PWT90_09142 [Aphanocladium album]|nr:hypothetical protein PWT90_09142 [Aphanocladium album]